MMFFPSTMNHRFHFDRIYRIPGVIFRNPAWALVCCKKIVDKDIDSA